MLDDFQLKSCLRDGLNVHIKGCPPENILLYWRPSCLTLILELCSVGSVVYLQSASYGGV